METDSMILAPVQPGDTLGLLLQRHGVERNVFFTLNPEKPVFYTEDNIPTTTLLEGEYVVIAAESVVRAQDGNSDYDKLTPALKERYNECIRYGGVFSPSTNQCCDPDMIQFGCTDIFERKRDEARVHENFTEIIVGSAVVVLAVVGGLIWWWRKPKTSA
jgi:hypothetical protein